MALPAIIALHVRASRIEIDKMTVLASQVIPHGVGNHGWSTLQGDELLFAEKP